MGVFIAAEDPHFGRWLRRQVETKGTPVTKFAAQMGVDPATVHRWFGSPVPKIRGFNFRRLAEAVGVEVGVIEARAEAAKAAQKVASKTAPPAPPKEEKAPPDQNISAPVPPSRWRDDMRPVPILNKIAAGPFVDERTRDFHVSRDGGWVDAPVGKTDAFALWVEGDSMEPRYRDGDLVVFKAVDPERHVVIDGADYAIQLSDDHFYEQTFKRLFNHPELGRFFLVATPINPETKPQRTELRRNQISRLGLAWMVFLKQG